MDDDRFRRDLEAEIPRLRRIAARAAPAGTDADDLVQDALERAWRNRESFRADAALSTWLYRIVLNRATDLATKIGASPVDVTDIPDSELFGFEVVNPQQVLERSADEAALRAALSQLHPIDRMLLVLHDGEGFAAREIAEAAGLSAAAAHKRLQRSRIKLARELAAQVGPPPRASGRCLSTRVLAADYLEGLLADADRDVVDAHLRDCPLCPPLAQAVLGLRAALEQCVPSSPVRGEVTRSLRAFTGDEAAS